ncbi:MAG: binary toxin-like calcium binding domain-containing protein [Luteolibacter sp.]
MAGLLAEGPVFASTEAVSPQFLVDTAVHILDTDGDKMPDAWESANGLNPSVNDAAGNPDGDHLNNLAEYNAGTRPLVFDYTATRFDVSGLFVLSLRPLAPDQDNDGMPDAWEATNGLNPALNDSAVDSDLDGLSNLAEYNAGWNPRLSEKVATLSAQSGVFLANTGAYPGGFTRDTDSDGMPDWWEVSYSLNPAVKDGGLDPDFDGLTNLQEYLTGHQPGFNDISGEVYQVSPLFVGNFAGRLPDTDHDGIPDIWESTFGTNPLIADALADPDGDGRNNISEYNAGTNPLINDWRGPSTVASGNFLADTGGFNGGYSPDTDHDRMPDWWELKYGLNPLVSDATGNLDADALTNLEEYNAGSDPSKFGFLILVDAQGNIFTCDTGGAFLDTDSDGIPDWWEKQNTGNRTAMNSAADSDGDGKSNLAEYVAGLNPLDPTSRFEVGTTQMTSDAQGPLFQVRWKTVSGRRYKIFSTANLGAPWPTVPVESVDGDGVDHVSNIRPGTAKTLFVRIEVEVIHP